MPTSSGERQHGERGRRPHVELRNLQRDGNTAREGQRVLGQETEERRRPLGWPMHDAVIGFEAAVEIGCAPFDVLDAAAARERAQRQHDEGHGDAAEEHQQHDPGADDDLRIEGAADAEVDRHERDDERRGREHGRAARDDERLQALAKLAEVGFELRLGGHAATPLRILRCQFPTADSTTTSISNKITSHGPHEVGTVSPAAVTVTGVAVSPGRMPRPRHRSSVAASIAVKSDSRGSKFTATTSVVPPPTTS